MRRQRSPKMFNQQSGLALMRLLGKLGSLRTLQILIWTDWDPLCEHPVAEQPLCGGTFLVGFRRTTVKELANGHRKTDVSNPLNNIVLICAPLPMFVDSGVACGQVRKIRTGWLCRVRNTFIVGWYVDSFESMILNFDEVCTGLLECSETFAGLPYKIRLD